MTQLEVEAVLSMISIDFMSVLTGFLDYEILNQQAMLIDNSIEKTSMNKSNYPSVAAGLGSVLLMILLLGNRPGPSGEVFLPLFTTLAISEVGFILTAAGAYFSLSNGLKTGGNKLRGLWLALGCTLLAVIFALTGVRYWPG